MYRYIITIETTDSDNKYIIDGIENEQQALRKMANAIGRKKALTVKLFKEYLDNDYQISETELMASWHDGQLGSYLDAHYY